MQKKLIVASFIVFVLLAGVPHISSASERASSQSQILLTLSGLLKQLISLQEELRLLKIENAKKITLKSSYFSDRGSVGSSTYSFKIKPPKNWSHATLGTAHAFGRAKNDFEGPGITLVVWDSEDSLSTLVADQITQIEDKSSGLVVDSKKVVTSAAEGWLVEYSSDDRYGQEYLFVDHDVVYLVSVGSKRDEWDIYKKILTQSVDTFKVR